MNMIEYRLFRPTERVRATERASRCAFTDSLDSYLLFLFFSLPIVEYLPFSLYKLKLHSDNLLSLVIF